MTLPYSGNTIDFAALIKPVALKLYGEPNRSHSKPTELRWGNNGARIVYPDSGSFYDAEANEKGGTLDLIQHVRGVDRAGALRWLEDNGFIDDRVQRSPASHALHLDRGQRIVATYEFRKDGVLHYRKHRIEPGRNGRSKDFLFDHPDSKGGWLAKRGDAAQIPYRLDAITGSTGPVVMAEGEKQADKLAGWGFHATSLKDWRQEFGDYLTGRPIVILPDNDEDGGKQAEKARSLLEKSGCIAHVINLPGLPPKGDIMDWDGNADDLAELVDKAINPPVETFPIANLEAWSERQPTPKSFIMPGFVPARELTLATGAGGANKSTFGQQLATCVAAGVPMLGIDVMHGPTLYITAEDDDERLHWMQARICCALGISMVDLVGKLHLASLRGRLGNELAVFDHEGRLRPAPSFHILKATIEQNKASLVVLDNAAHLFAGNENDRQQVTAFVNLLYSLCQDLGATIILVAHANKAGDTYSGSTAWLNAVRSQIVISRPDDTLDPDERILSLGKANYARQGQELRFRWHEFALVRDEDLPEDKRKELAEIIQANNDNETFLRCLRERNRQRRPVSERSSKTYAPIVFAEMPEGKRIGRVRLEKAMDRLFRVGRIERGFLFRDTSEGKDKHGLKEVDMASDIPANAPDNVPPTHSDNTRQPAENDRQHTPYSINTISGVASGPAAPEEYYDGQGSRTQSDDGLDENGNVIGWDD